jgi:hypothetical protein
MRDRFDICWAMLNDTMNKTLAIDQANNLSKDKARRIDVTETPAQAQMPHHHRAVEKRFESVCMTAS